MKWGLTLLALALAPSPLAAQAVSAQTSEIDLVFQQWDHRTTPGCAVAVDRADEPRIFRAYGMADLEHAVPISDSTIFEAGSVAKQFTAAAVILLVLDGKISLDDDVRTYIPELPDYGTPITIRHLLNHTSGLRDWGSVAAIAGWGRSHRTHTHAHVLDILSRQSELNHAPGDEYSYTNSGYNLLAILVQRVTGSSLAEFSRERIFEPLGLDDTQWRDDYRRIVPNRASAYAPSDGEYLIDRPIEHVYGNGGLLTTVNDLLRWDRHLRTGQGLGGDEFVRLMHERARLNDGQVIPYASGVIVGDYRGIPTVSHTGATSGYRAYLARFPEQEMAIAILCNTAGANTGRLGGQVADVFLDVPEPDSNERLTAPGPDADRPAERYEPDAADLAAYVGRYYSADAELAVEIQIEAGSLVAVRRPDARSTLRPLDQDAFNGWGLIRFQRDDNDEVSGFVMRSGRVHNLFFGRVEE